MDFPHHMLREIYEQPRGVRDTVEPRLTPERDAITLPGSGLTPESVRRLERVRIAASGSSRHAGIAGKYMLEQLAGLPVEVDHASEFAYRNPIVERSELVVAITQSGETADTLQALREAKSRGCCTLAIANVVASTIPREADGVLYTYAGREISIAATKSFTAQLAVLYLLALYCGQQRGVVSAEAARGAIAALVALPGLLERVLESDAACRTLAEQYHTAEDFLYLGRGVHYAVALDGALKLKEVTYIHAEGYPAGEMKHGPNALIDEALPVIVLATRDAADEGSRVRYDKTMANLREVKARGGRVIALANENDEEIAAEADHVVWIPSAPELLLPMLEIVPLQLVAYHIAVRKGLNVDRPRNLAKAVLVE